MSRNQVQPWETEWGRKLGFRTLKNRRFFPDKREFCGIGRRH